MSFRKTTLIDRISHCHGEEMYCQLKWHLIQCSLPCPTGCQKNSIFLVRSGKQGETEKEGGQAAQSQPSASHAHFHRNKTGSSVLWCEKKPSQAVMKRKLVSENSVTCLKLVVFMILSLLLSFFKMWGYRAKRQPQQDCVVHRQLCKTQLLSGPPFPCNRYLQFQLVRSSQIIPDCVMIQYWK